MGVRGVSGVVHVMSSDFLDCGCEVTRRGLITEIPDCVPLVLYSESDDGSRDDGRVDKLYQALTVNDAQTSVWF